MTDESEVGIIDSVDHFTGPQNQNLPGDSVALVEVKFQKNSNQEQKYLEAEPKALGITQIMLSVFIISTKTQNVEAWMVYQLQNIITFSFSVVGIIAGSVAIAAQNLQLPKLKACLGMQILTCAVSVISFIFTIGMMIESRHYFSCYNYHFPNSTKGQALCEQLSAAYDHFVGLELLMHAAQIAMSATLAAFCCKVIQCCSPRSRVPIVVVSTPSAPQ